LSSNCPYPPDHGRSIDTFEKIKALHHEGIKIHLHYLNCGDGHEKNISCYCESIHSYKNTEQMNRNLKENISNDNFPLLAEGNFCSEFLNSTVGENRKVIVRLYDTELESANSFPEKRLSLQNLFHLNASKKHQSNFQESYLYICISKKKAETLREQYHLSNVMWLPPFVSWHEIKCKEGSGNFCLYHGNLSSPANEKVAIWLLEKVFSVLRYPFVIAGKSPTRKVYKLAQLYSHSCIVANPSEDQIDDLIQKAHINIVPCMQSVSGKYKLLHSLFSGRHCLTNGTMLNDTGLEEACHIANDRQSKIETIKKLIEIPFRKEEIELRKDLLLLYNNSENIRKLIGWLY
jgi:hypothetical protein